MIPPAFQTPRALKVLNIGAVGFALASVVAPLLETFPSGTGLMGIVGGVPTLLIGMLWAWLLRQPQTVGTSSIRRGWVASIPLAILNAALTAGLLVMSESSPDGLGKFVMGLLVGATFGAIIWIPALLATLLCFGVPIARAQQLAKKGLAGEERGEWIVGLTCLVISLVGLVISSENLSHGNTISDAALWIPRVFGLLGVLASVSSTVLARARAARRRTFVAEAEAGNIKGYRVDVTDEGKVLVQIAAQGKGYRVADFEKEVFELDEEGEAVRPKHFDDVAAS
jgi:hypothetical protein